MEDKTELDLLHRMSMTVMEEKLFVLWNTGPGDLVIGPLRDRHYCHKCLETFDTEHLRLWHQITHEPTYTGFINHLGQEKLPNFDYHIMCPFTNCELKFVDVIDCKMHYLLEHRNCQLYCCQERFTNFVVALDHLVEAKKREPAGRWPEPGHGINMCPYYVCNCCGKIWSSRNEYQCHLQGRHHMCADPVCKHIFEDNERAVRHFFETHYKHLTMDARQVLLAYQRFQDYEERYKERLRGKHQCNSCHRRFYREKSLMAHLEYMKNGKCVLSNPAFFTPVIPCKCNYHFIYCYHQRDILLRQIPILREALEHIAREAPYNGIQEDICNIYRSMIFVLSDVLERLNQEKYKNYQRTDSSSHSRFTSRQVTLILLGTMDYFVKIM
ncbi:unnamed protein product [Caenorhabditis brenneri]